MEALKIPISDCVKDATLELTITGLTVFTWRISLAIFFIKVAAWVFPTKAEVKIDEQFRN